MSLIHLNTCFLSAWSKLSMYRSPNTKSLSNDLVYAASPSFTTESNHSLPAAWYALTYLVEAGGSSLSGFVAVGLVGLSVGACLCSFVLLLFMFSHTGRTYLCVETIANAVRLVNSHLDIFAPFFSSRLFSFIFMMFVLIGFWWGSLRLVVLVFEGYLELHTCCRLLVVVRSLRLVILFFEECLELSGGVLLFVVGCWLLCDHFVWSYWFSKNDLNFLGMCYSLM